LTIGFLCLGKLDHALHTSDQEVRRHCWVSDPWWATPSIRTNLDFGSDSKVGERGRRHSRGPSARTGPGFQGIAHLPVCTENSIPHGRKEETGVHPIKFSDSTGISQSMCFEERTRLERIVVLDVDGSLSFELSTSRTTQSAPTTTLPICSCTSTCQRGMRA
jgi:hypothetical protein